MNTHITHSMFVSVVFISRGNRKWRGLNKKIKNMLAASMCMMVEHLQFNPNWKWLFQKLGVVRAVLCRTCNHTQQWSHGVLEYTCALVQQGRKQNHLRLGLEEEFHWVLNDSLNCTYVSPFNHLKQQYPNFLCKWQIKEKSIVMSLLREHLNEWILTRMYCTLHSTMDNTIHFNGPSSRLSNCISFNFICLKKKNCHFATMFFLHSYFLSLTKPLWIERVCKQSTHIVPASLHTIGTAFIVKYKIISKITHIPYIKTHRQYFGHL